QAEDGIRDGHVTGVQTCALPISWWTPRRGGVQPPPASHASWTAVSWSTTSNCSRCEVPGSQPRPVLLLLGLLAGVPAPGRAAVQVGPRPTLVLTLVAGVADGAGLWTVPRQPFCPVYSSGSCASTARPTRIRSSSTTRHSGSP